MGPAGLLLLLPLACRAEALPESKAVHFEAYHGSADLTLRGDTLSFALRSTSGCELRGDARKESPLTYAWHGENNCLIRIGVGAGEIRASYSAGCPGPACRGAALPPEDFHLPLAACQKDLALRKREAARAFSAKSYAEAARLYDSIRRQCKAFQSLQENVRLILKQARAEARSGDSEACQLSLSRVRDAYPFTATAPRQSFLAELRKAEKECKKARASVK